MKPPPENARCVSLSYDVLLIIFQRATSVPNAFDIHEPDLFAYPAPWSQEKIQAALFKSMYTKYRLALVCKAWNDVATPLLYQSVCISKRKSFMALLRSVQIALTDGRNESGDVAESISSSSKGKWTKRLDILYQDKAVLQASSFARFLKCLPNLQIIVQRGKFLMLKRSNVLLPIFVVLPALPARSLRVLDVRCCSYSNTFVDGHYYPNVTSITNAIGDQPLRTLKVFPAPDDQTIEQHEFLSYVECLDAPRDFVEPILMGTCTAPKLERLSLIPVAGFTMGLGSNGKCLACIGSRLKQLELNRIPPYPVYLQQGWHDITDLCPNLHTLIVALDVSTVCLLPGYLPPVSNLGIHLRLSSFIGELYDEHYITLFWELLCSKLTKLIPEAPSLRIVRILDELPYETCSTRGFFVVKASTTSKELMQHGVRFEDCTGQLFHND